MRNTIAGVCALAWVAAGCSSNEPPRGQSSQPLTVTTAATRMLTVAEPLQAGGVIAARQSAALSSRIVAPVAEVRVRAGDRIKRGQVLVVLDANDLSARATEASAVAGAADQGLALGNAELTAATAERKLALTWHNRISTLHARNSATAQELDEAEARLAAATSRLDAARARLEQTSASVRAANASAAAAQTTRSFATIVSPFDGLVTERLADPGSLASPGVPLLRVDGNGAPRVHVMVDEHRAAYLSVGDVVRVEIGASATDSPEARVEGTVAEINRELAAGQRAFLVKIDLPQTVQATAGGFARITFGGAPRSVLVVASTALRRHGQVVSTFVVDAGVARLRVLQVGSVAGEGVEVLAGLDPGERVILDPPSGLIDGRSVTERQAAPGVAK